MRTAAGTPIAVLIFAAAKTDLPPRTIGIASGVGVKYGLRRASNVVAKSTSWKNATIATSDCVKNAG